MKGLAPGVAILTLAGSAHSQSITSGLTSFSWNSTAIPTTGTGIGGGSSNLDVNGASAGGDQLFENWWWYRVEGVDAREFRYHAPANPFVVSDQAMTGAFEFANFRSELRYEFIIRVLQPVLATTNRITNTTASSVTLSIYNYFDFDLNGEVAGNSYSYQPPTDSNGGHGRFIVNDSPPVAVTAYIQAFGASAHQAAPFTTTPGTPVRGLVADADIDDLNNTVTGSPADFTGAFQWRLTLGPGDSAEVTTWMSINVDPWFPGPGTAAPLVIGGAALLRRRRPDC